jgi:hypothetical protein
MSKVLIDVIVHEHNLNGYNPSYYFAAKWEGREWGTNSSHYDSIKDLTREIAENIVGTEFNYRLDSFFLEGVPNFKEGGIKGFSESSQSMIITRLLDRGEIRDIAINLGIAIKERKRVLDS